YCRRGDGSRGVVPRFAGWDVAGGYAEYAVVDAAYAYALPDVFDDIHVAPLLCAGIIGYRALRRASLPPRGRLGIYGFGASAHLAAQVAMFEGATVHVLTRSPDAQRLALDLGAASAAGAADTPPEPLAAPILFAPAGTRNGHLQVGAGDGREGDGMDATRAVTEPRRHRVGGRRRRDQPHPAGAGPRQLHPPGRLVGSPIDFRAT